MKNAANCLALLIASLLLSACALQTYSVQLNPVGNSGDMKVVAKGKRCPESRNPHDGCLLFAKNTSGLITFYLPGSNPSASDKSAKGSSSDILRLRPKTCADHGTNRVITKIQLTSTGADDNPIAQKGDFSNLGDVDSLRATAFPVMNAANGEIFSAATVDDGLSVVRIFNNNANVFNEGTYQTFWYRVTVSHCTNGSTWTTDPRGDNEGTTW